MTPAFSARRRADEFEALLSRGPGVDLTDREAERFTTLLAVVADLRAVADPEPRPEFVSDLRARLMAEADTVLVRRPAAPERLAMPVTSRPRQRRLGALVGGVAVVGAAATMAVASQGSLPGESLYGVKRGIESAQVRLAGDDAARGRTLLAQADTRLDELEQLAAVDRGEERAVPDTLDAFTRQSSEGVRSLLTAYDASGTTADAQHVRDFTSTSLERLDALEPSIPESARDQLVAAGQMLADLDQEASAACLSCTGGVVETPPFLLTSAAVPDLLAGLDADQLQLEAAPVPGQDLTGITVPPALQPSAASPTPTAQPTGQPTAAPTPPTPLPPVPTASPTKPGRGTITDVTEGLTGTVTGTTSGITQGIDGLTGGAVGGLTGSVDDATGGLISEVTGTVDGLTGHTLNDATGGLLP